MRKRILYISIFVSILLTLGVTVYAMFTYNNKFKTNINTYTINNTSIVEPTSSLDITFNNSGEVVDFTYGVTNNDSNAYFYNFVLIGDSVDSTLTNMIYVYFDSKYIGVLSSLLNKEISTDLFINSSETRTNQISFELHNSSNLLKNSAIRIRIRALVKTIDKSKFILANNEETFIKAINDVNQSSSDRNVILTDDITLNTDLTLINGVNLDLCGKNLVLNNSLLINGVNEQVVKLAIQEIQVVSLAILT